MNNLAHVKRTPLMHATQNSYISMIKLLLSHGAKLNGIDDLGFNALDYAVMGTNKENESFLKTLGLKLGVPAHFPDSQATD
jgi:ankyrin repeat protein